MTPLQKLGHMFTWYRGFHGSYPRTVVVTKTQWVKLLAELPSLRRHKKILGAKIEVLPEKIQGRSHTYMIVDDVEHDLDVRAPWSNEFNQEFSHSERDVALHELAKRYHEECEAYDRTVCTGPVRHGAVLPADGAELVKINIHAAQVRGRIIAEANAAGFSRLEVLDSFSHYAATHP